MPWQSLENFELTHDWVFSRSVEGELFRLIHQPIADLPEQLMRGVIAQGFIDEDSRPNKFSSRIFAYGVEPEVFTFYFPVGLSKHSIILRRLDKNPIPWTVELQMFASDNPEEDYQNYLISRFGTAAITQFSQSLITQSITNMSLYPLLFSGSTKPESKSIKLNPNSPSRVLDKNDARTEIRLYSTNHPLLLTTGFEENGEPLEILLRVPPNYYHQDVITTAGMYKGEIYAICEQETNIYVTEFSAQ
jgi:hypothetical protein